MVSRPTYIGGLGFDYKWNMGWMHDMLKYMSQDPIFRRYHHNHLTFSLLYAFTENFVLPFSHDEVVHLKRSMLDKMPGDIWQKFANLRALYAYMVAHPGKKLLFMGDEFGQWTEWNFTRGLDWVLLNFDTHQGLLRCVRDLNGLLRSEPALHEQDFSWEGFEWIDFRDVDQSIVSFIRRAKRKEPAGPQPGEADQAGTVAAAPAAAPGPQKYNQEALVVVASFTPVPRTGYRVGVPEPGNYREIFNSDSDYYGGSNVGNGTGLEAEPFAWQDQPYSVMVTLPPLGVIYLKRE
jgi:1,4-alpha-glucan branching enzyme